MLNDTMIQSNTRLSHWLLFGLGCLMTLAYAPFRQSYLVIPILTSVLYCMESCLKTNRQAIQGIGLFSVALFACHHHWLLTPMIDVIHLNPLFSGLLLLLLASVLAVFVAGPFLVVFYTRDWLPRHLRLLWLFPLLWLLAEALRSQIFPWGLLGYSQTESMSLKPLIPYVGSLGVGWVICWLSAYLTCVIIEPAAKYTLASISSLIICVLLVGYLLPYEASLVVKDQAPIEFITIQHNEKQDIYQPKPAYQSMQQQMTLTQQYADPGQLVIWPENALPPAGQSSIALKDLSNDLARLNIDLLSGITWYNDQGITPSVLLLDRSNKYHGVKFKQHLVPFGEVIPLQSLVQPIIDHLGIPMYSMTHQQADYDYFDYHSYQIYPMLCYDIIFPNVIGKLSQADAGVVLSNSNWFGQSIASHQHVQIAQAAAIESGRQLVFANNSGIVAFIDVLGNLTQMNDDFAKPVMTGSIEPVVKQHFFGHYGYAGLALLIGLYNLVGFFVFRLGKLETF